MTTININHVPALSVQFAPCLPRVDIDLATNFCDRLGEKELNKDSALKILKSIKLEADIYSFVAQPIVLIPASLLLIVAGAAIPMAGAILTVTALFLQCVGVFMFGYSVAAAYKGSLDKISEAYASLSQAAHKEIEKIESAKGPVNFNINKGSFSLDLLGLFGLQFS